MGHSITGADLSSLVEEGLSIHTCSRKMFEARSPALDQIFTDAESLAQKPNSMRDIIHSSSISELTSAAKSELSRLSAYKGDNKLFHGNNDLPQYFIIYDGQHIALADTQGYDYPRYAMIFEPNSPAYREAKRVVSSSKVSL